ncbi:MAG TPA: hypothetical protein VMF30_15950, partial [Pirellulales bacterium]|nr:hypothetical protein [Pirellulales bacterium]
MPAHRFPEFYEQYFHHAETLQMGIEDKNKELNAVVSARLKKLQGAIEEYEASLRKLMIPRDVWHTYRSQDHEDDHGQCCGSTEYMIGMSKVGGNWRLCHGVSEQWGPGYFESKPLVDTPIPFRLEGIKHLEELRHEIVEKKKELIPEIEDAIEGIQAALENPKTWNEVTRKKGHFARPRGIAMLAADVIHAIINDESDTIKVWSNPDMPLERKEGEPHFRPNFVSVRVHDLDGLFALQLHVRQMRGPEGMMTREERRHQLVQMAKARPDEFRKIAKKRLGFMTDEPLSDPLIERAANQISHEEVAW